ncbi:nucleolar complex protein 3 homolog [Aricia agestis]|uniref:nucleolar complex protein 3 homolog n=1 Tax=Aricia agestis TaxID=91739 RepID=UPI001C204FCC|nr:nucleolar complex protein 3 homolog [Aricia agestis]
MAKKGKHRVSKVKKNNQTTNKMKKQGKLKLQRHRTKVQKQRQPTQAEPEYSSESEESSNEWADMLDEEEQAYITGRLARQPQLLSDIPPEEEKKKNLKRKRTRKKEQKQGKQKPGSDSGAASLDDSENSDVEEQYEKELSERPVKKLRPLLPIKTKEGVVERMEECEESDSDKEEESPEVQSEEEGSESEGSDSGVEDKDKEEKAQEPETITTVQLLAARRDRLQHEKLRIGALCSSLLESPEKKLKNLFPILYLMEERLRDGTPNLLSVRKLASLSAAEVYRDLLPDYKIRHQDYTDVKLKKDTLALYKYEKELLEFYKRYLQRLEKATNVLRRKMGDNRKPDEGTLSLALISLRCMGGMLVARPQFNYADNIAQTLVPHLDSRVPAARDIVKECIETVFREDNKGDITLTIVRLINQLVKRRGERLHPSALDCLLALDIRDVQLDEQVDLQHKHKQDAKHKKRIINLSKKEKKRAKKLKEVERELLETRAAEDAAARRRTLAEVTRTVFLIYFRVLKTAPHSRLLAAALDGLAKFTHVINLEYYSELVAILTALSRDGLVSASSQLRCVCCVLAVLRGAGDALNVDPAAAHDRLFAAAATVTSAEDVRMALEGVSEVTRRARRVSAGVLQAFAKRLAELAARLPPHAALAALALLHQLLQHKPVSLLLAPEEGTCGRYSALSPSAEHCGAAAAGLHELAVLARSVHPTVRAAATAMLNHTWPHELTGLTPMQIYKQYDGSQLCFKPAIPPKPLQTAKSIVGFAQPSFGAECTAIEETTSLTLKENVVR